MEQQGIFEKPMVKWGLYLGGLNVAYILVLYLIDVSLLISFWNSAISLTLLIVFMVLAMKEQRRNNNEALSYGNVVVIGIAVGIISSLIGVIFNGLLYNYIDPTLPETIRELTLEKTLGMMESMGASEETIEQAMGNMDERQFQQDLRASFTALLISSLFSAFVALIVAAFVKKEAPLFEEEA
jgi:hypothetical protein